MHFKKALNVSIYKVFRAFFTQFLAKVRKHTAFFCKMQGKQEKFGFYRDRILSWAGCFFYNQSLSLACYSPICEVQ